jgi:hypothetical protein
MHRIILLTLSLMSGATSTSAQSVLERVLGQIDGATNLAQVNGTYANIAESIGLSGTATTESVSGNFSNAPADAFLWSPLPPIKGYTPTYITVADVGKTYTVDDGSGFLPSSSFPTGTTLTVNADGGITFVNTSPTSTMTIHGPYGQQVLPANTTTTLSLPSDATLYQPSGSVPAWLLSSQAGTGPLDSPHGGLAFFNVSAADIVFIEVPTTTPGLSNTIDGSITNIISGVTSSTAEAVAGASTATEFTLPTLDLGDMATTALGAVNTGEITLGVNSAVDEASTSTTNAIAAVMTQIGGSSDTGALVLNVASNASVVNGSINNIMNDVNGSISSASTTALGAVNTGTITSGLNAVVQGITGMSGQSASSL